MHRHIYPLQILDTNYMGREQQKAIERRRTQTSIRYHLRKIEGTYFIVLGHWRSQLHCNRFRENHSEKKKTNLF